MRRPSAYTVARWLTDSKRIAESPSGGALSVVRYQATAPSKLAAPAAPRTLVALGEKGTRTVRVVASGRTRTVHVPSSGMRPVAPVATTGSRTTGARGGIPPARATTPSVVTTTARSAATIAGRRPIRPRGDGSKRWRRQLARDGASSVETYRATGGFSDLRRGARAPAQMFIATYFVSRYSCRPSGPPSRP